MLLAILAKSTPRHLFIQCVWNSLLFSSSFLSKRLKLTCEKLHWSLMRPCSIKPFPFVSFSIGNFLCQPPKANQGKGYSISFQWRRCGAASICTLRQCYTCMKDMLLMLHLQNFYTDLIEGLEGSYSDIETLKWRHSKNLIFYPQTMEDPCFSSNLWPGAKWL